MTTSADNEKIKCNISLVVDNEHFHIEVDMSVFGLYLLLVIREAVLQIENSLFCKIVLQFLQVLVETVEFLFEFDPLLSSQLHLLFDVFVF